MENLRNLSQLVFSTGAEQISQSELPLQIKLVLEGLLCIAIIGIVGISAMIIYQDINRSK